MSKKAYGFTIVELLIVIVVIGILAAITIVAYTGIQNRAHDTTVKSDLSSLARKLELYRVDDPANLYPQTLADLNSINFKLTKRSYDTNLNNVYYITSTSDSIYAFGVRSKSGNGFALTNSGVQTMPTVNASATGNTIGLTWGAAGSVARQGVSTSGTAPNWIDNWSMTWNWTN